MAGPSVVRCAVYCRQSVSEGSGESASIGVQREACLSFIQAHVAEGWTALPDAYVDQNISGATLQRPAMQRLLADVAADRVDAIVTYKLDRVSRNLADFSGLVAMLEQRGVRLVSVTQSFDTKSAIGRLTLGILMSFSEFERSLVSERTRDAVQAARRKGRWTGGVTPWGYNLVAGKLIPDPVEAHRVTETFRIYLETGSLIATAEALNTRGWTTKVSATRNGGTRGGVAWSKSSVHRVLSSPAYVARMVVDGEAFQAEHEAIVRDAIWTATQERLERNGGAHTRGERHKSDSLLAGLIFCGGCGAAMTPSSARKGPRVYRYYRCSRQVKHGRAACPAPHVSAPKVEAEVVAEIARVVRDTPTLIPEIVTAAKERLATTRRSLAGERRAIGKAMRGDDSRHAGGYRARLASVEEQGERLAGVTIGPDAVRDTVGEFHALWGALTGRERRRVVEVLVERAVVPNDSGPIAMTLRARA